MPISSFRAILDRKHLPALDGLRAVAVLIVVLGHAGLALPTDLGVSAFFVLSGFLITRLLLREDAETGRVSLSQFYLRRTLRIFPAYYAFIAFSFAVDHVRGDAWSPAMLASAVGYVMNYYNAATGHPGTSVAHAWSLAVEEQFYLLWPVLFILAARRGRRALIATLVGICGSILVWRSVLYLGAGVGPAYIYNALDTRFDNLAIGCLLAVIVELPRTVRLGEAVARTQWLPLATLALLLTSRYWISEAYHYTLGFTVNAVLMAVLLVQFLQLQSRPLWRWLEHPVTRYLGLISYPMYLYHSWAGSVARHLPFAPTSWEPVTTVAVTILLATGSYYVVERPFLSLKHRFAPGRGQRTATPVAAPAGASVAATSQVPAGVA